MSPLQFISGLPFRYKLTLILSLIILGLVTTLDFITLRNIEARFRLLIHDNLQRTERLVNQRLEEGYDQLFASAVAASGQKLVMDLLTDDTLSEITRNDIVESELLNSIVDVDFLAVMDGDGQWRGMSDHSVKQLSGKTLTIQLARHHLLEDVLEGEIAVGHIFVDTFMVQLVAVPVFIGEQMIGCVLLGKHFSQENLQAISDAVNAVVAILNDHQLVMNSHWQERGAFVIRLQEGSLSSVPSHFAHNANKREPMGDNHQAIQLRLKDDRYLLRHVVDENKFFPDYVVAKSLDAELMFVDGIRSMTFVVSALGLIVALLISLLVAMGVARPIARLKAATREAEQENFAYRVAVTGRDELGRLSQAFNNMMQGLQEKQTLREALDKSVSKEVASHLLSEGTELGGQSVEATVLFSDIRGFTELSEKLTETQLIELLNHYFSSMNQCILSHQGVIDKFIGDAVMAIFGAPVTTSQHALEALQSAQEMLDRLDVFNREVALNYGCQLSIGIGINTGTLVAGLVGSSDRLNYTVLGDQVNLASRIEGLCKYYGVPLILSEDTLQSIQACGDSDGEIQGWYFRELDQVQVKGRQTACRLYQPLRIQTASQSQSVDDYQASRQLLLAKDFSRAITTLQRLLSKHPDDTAAQALLFRCQGYLQVPDSFVNDYQNSIRCFDHK